MCLEYCIAGVCSSQRYGLWAGYILHSHISSGCWYCLWVTGNMWDLLDGCMWLMQHVLQLCPGAATACSTAQEQPCATVGPCHSGVLGLYNTALCQRLQGHAAQPGIGQSRTQLQVVPTPAIPGRMLGLEHGTGLAHELAPCHSLLLSKRYGLKKERIWKKIMK